MSTLGFSAIETQTTWNIVAGILHLVGKSGTLFSQRFIYPSNNYMHDSTIYFFVTFQGNVTFRLDDDKLIIENNSALNDTANLLSINSKDLSTALSQRVIAAGGEVMQKTHTLIEAEYGRDALAKVRVQVTHFLIKFPMI